MEQPAPTTQDHQRMPPWYEVIIISNILFIWLHCPIEFTSTIIVWVSCMSYLFFKEDNYQHPPRTTPCHISLKNQSRYLPRRKPKMMSWTSVKFRTASQCKENAPRFLKQLPQQLKVQELYFRTLCGIHIL